MPTPNVSAMLLWSPTMTQELEIAAGDQRSAALDETDDAIAQRRGLPRLGSDAPLVIESECDVAIAGAVSASVCGQHHGAQALSLLCGHPRVGERRATFDGAPKAG